MSKIVGKWSERPRLGANQMITKYGMPTEATADKLIWKMAGPYKRIVVMNLETPHDFPLPHVDFMEHTISYLVPPDKLGDLLAFDGSSTINRTAGELSARCDLEGHNVLTLNLDKDIIDGKKTVEQARQVFGEVVVQDNMGKHPAYLEMLQFQPMQPMAAMVSDQSVIAGVPVRYDDTDPDAAKAIAMDGPKRSDAEIIATLVAVDLNEIMAAGVAEKKNISGPVKDYAQMLHEMHGTGMSKSLSVGSQIGVTPITTPASENMKMKGAGELASYTLTDGKKFEKAYLAHMVKGHQEALDTIDSKLLPMAMDSTLKAHIQETRSHIAMHLKQAQQLQKTI